MSRTTEFSIRRTSEHCARTAVERHGPKICDGLAVERLELFGWKCECECHDREEKK